MISLSSFNKFFDKFKILSGSALKIIAVISMFIDHSAHVLKNDLGFMNLVLFSFGGIDYSIYYIMRFIGRLAFPIFCFLIVQGFIHTKNVKKYCLRLLAFAFISEIPFNLMMRGSFIDPGHQNIYFTLFIGVIVLWIYEKTDGHLFKFGFITVLVVITHFLNTDYGAKGVLLILLIYVLRQSPSMQVLFSNFLLSSTGKLFSLCAFIPINMYNGERGFIKSKALKLGFYIFYPAHILLLVAIKFLIK